MKMSFFISALLFLMFITIPSAAQSKKELKVGDKAPNFVLKDAFGKTYNLKSYKNKYPVIVYFYPEAGTPGCTKEACGIRDDWSKFKKNDIKVLGISVDPKSRLKSFIHKYKLNFPLLSDINKEVSKEYGVYSPKGYDKRVTFILDKKGNIAKIINVTNIEKHAAEVFNFAMKLK